MSCATHRLDGGLPLTVTLVDSAGNPIKTLANT